MRPHLDQQHVPPDGGGVVERPSDLTAAWLTGAVGSGTVTDFSVERIGTGQMSECYRIRLSYDDGAPTFRGPQSVVMKVAATDPVSRQTGLAMGLYEREVRFYREIAPRIPGPLARCYHAAFDGSAGVFDVLLGDASPATVGDELCGATAEQAELAVVELARLHGPLLGDTALAGTSWLNRDAPINQALIIQLYTGFIDRYRDQIPSQYRTVCDRLVNGFDAYLAGEAASERIHGLVHGDYRLDNLLFGIAGADRPLTVVDWQTVTWGPAMTDLAYFLGCALSVDDRRTQYDALLQAYHETLGPHAPLTLEDVRDGVRRQSFFGVMMAIVSSMLVERTERGGAMFMTMLQRHCDHVLDTEALEILPASTAPEPLRPAGVDESAHTPTDEPLWSESWYADFADVTQGFGGWVRLGRIPNERKAWLHALLCGPNIATTAVIDFDVALPADPWTVRTDSIDFTHAAGTPLHTYHVALQARGLSHTDPANLLRGDAGTPVEVAMELVWVTDGTPYQYRLTTRYEIPCIVSGTVTVGDNRYTFDAVPGQRDHSWGVRDWWSMDWLWSALHLDDGTHLHGVDLRIPGAPALGIGYLQDADGNVAELHAIATREAFAANGLPEATTINFNPAGVTVTAEMQGHAPLRLVAADGRISQFARGWATVVTADGRRGVGWLEWNRNQPPQ